MRILLVEDREGPDATCVQYNLTLTDNVIFNKMLMSFIHKMIGKFESRHLEYGDRSVLKPGVNLKDRLSEDLINHFNEEVDELVVALLEGASIDIEKETADVSNVAFLLFWKEREKQEGKKHGK